MDLYKVSIVIYWMNLTRQNLRTIYTWQRIKNNIKIDDYFCSETKACTLKKLCLVTLMQLSTPIGLRLTIVVGYLTTVFVGVKLSLPNCSEIEFFRLFVASALSTSTHWPIFVARWCRVGRWAFSFKWRWRRVRCWHIREVIYYYYYYLYSYTTRTDNTKNWWNSATNTQNKRRVNN